jgi:hypothetical protein
MIEDATGTHPPVPDGADRDRAPIDLDHERDAAGSGHPVPVVDGEIAAAPLELERAGSARVDVT